MESLRGLIPPDPANQPDRHELLEGMLSVKRDGRWLDAVSGEEVIPPGERRPFDLMRVLRARYGDLPDEELARLHTEAYEKRQREKAG